MVKSVSPKQQHENSTINASSCKFKGVRKRKWGKYVSEIRLPNSRERIWLGSYDSAEKAARAFDAALFCLRGRTAKFNFPDNPPDIVKGRSLTPPEIQVAAAKYANSETRMKSSGPDHSFSSASDLHVDTPSPLNSSGVVPSDVEISEIPLDFAFLDIISTVGSGNYSFADNGIFPGFDDFSDDVNLPSLTSSVDYGEENCDYLSSEGSFLWNF